ncbi:MAG: hypothetical protein JWQ16_1669, partial [Novosphingobium sp.]|nr:hypothetical protein [Novosphingobium sp.]
AAGCGREGWARGGAGLAGTGRAGAGCARGAGRGGTGLATGRGGGGTGRTIGCGFGGCGFGGSGFGGCGLGGCGMGGSASGSGGAGSPRSGATSGAGLAAGSGEVDFSPTSSEIVTVMRSGGGRTGLPSGRQTRNATSAMCAATASARPTRSSRTRAVAAISGGYCAVAELFVTSEIELNPARLSSPITPMTRP